MIFFLLMDRINPKIFPLTPNSDVQSTLLLKHGTVCSLPLPFPDLIQSDEEVLSSNDSLLGPSTTLWYSEGGDLGEERNLQPHSNLALGSDPDAAYPSV